jgi:hypothetical protein
MLAGFAARPAQGQTLSDWTTATHFGYAVNKESSTGFKNVGGSLFFLDLLQDVGDSMELGMRTIAQGGEDSSSEYYRMGVGPMISWQLAGSWRAQFSLSFFNETASDADSEKAYQSRGKTYQLGWERHRTLMKNVELAWGGFYMMHEGSVNLTERAASTKASSRFANISTNRGTSQGVELALRFKL